jgi:hypothetical protein
VVNLQGNMLKISQSHFIEGDLEKVTDEELQLSPYQDTAQVDKFCAERLTGWLSSNLINGPLGRQFSHSI